jgi:hypothetical protein
MFLETNIINIDDIEESFSIKFNCSLCNGSNIFNFNGFEAGFFKRKVGYEWKTIEYCPFCNKLCEHLIIFKTDGEVLEISVKDPLFTDEYSRKTPLKIYVSHYDEGYDWQIPLELEVLDYDIGNVIFIEAKQSLLELEREIHSNSNKSKIILYSLFSTSISIFEAFLGELLISTCINDERIFRMLIEKTNIFEKETILKKDIYTFQTSIKQTAIDKLKDKTFHNIGVACAFYNKCLNIDISQYLGIVPNSVNIRHDIVHRNGKTKDGKEILIELKDLELLINDIKNCIEQINIEFEKKGLDLGDKKTMSSLEYGFSNIWKNENNFHK